MSDEFAVLAFWKGTSYPTLFSPSKQEWEQMQGVFDEALIEGLKQGLSLDQQATDYTNQLNEIEKFLNDWYIKINQKVGRSRTARRSGKVQKRLKADIEKEFGEDFQTIQIVWYMNIHSLLKLKKIENDDKFGFMYINKSNSSNNLNHFWSANMPINRVV